MADNPSERLVDQRVRNRIIEATQTLAEGDAGVRAVWPAEFFETFYDQVPHHRDGNLYPNSALTADELAALAAVRSILDAACDATPGQQTAEEFIATGWPIKIAPIAAHAMNVFSSRGRFSEDVEEAEPSFEVARPYTHKSGNT